MNADAKAEPLVADIIEIMETLAPPALAESWDNCGLQVGSRNWPVKKIWVALDPLFQVLDAASRHQVDLVITHHPLLIKPWLNIDIDSPLGRVIEKAITTKTAIYSAHTNLDSAEDGLNDLLARALGMKDCIPMVPSEVPADDQNTTVERASLGLGRVGRLEPAIPVDQLVQRIKSALKLDWVRVAGDRSEGLAEAPARVLEKVAVCSGGGGGLLEAFFKSDAQAYICGDLRYHDAREAENRGRILIDVGHFPSEHIVVEDLTQRLQDEIKRLHWPVQVEACRLEKEPFFIV